MTKTELARSRAAYHHGDLRNALIAAAVDLIAEKGVEGFSLREAARAVGVSPAATYRHFADREALLAAVSFDGFHRLALRMRVATERRGGPRDPRARAAADLAAVGAAYVDFAVESPAQFRVMFGPWCALAAGLPEAMVEEGDPFSFLVAVLDRLVETGAIPAERRPGAELAAWSLVHGFASLLVEDAIELTAEPRAAAYAGLARTLLVGLGCDPSLLGPARAGPRAVPRKHGKC
jgi:AcrR family transcriptional regulator